MRNLSGTNSSKTITKQLMHDLNTRTVTSLLYAQGPTSRAEISRKMDLAPATISNITAKLLSLGLVEEVGFGKSTGGRKPTLLDINEKFGYVVAVKIEARHVITGLYDLRANKIAGNSIQIPPEPKPEFVQNRIAEAAKTYSSKSEVLGIGIGVSGLISDNGEIIYSPILNWKHIPLADLLSKELSIPIVADNDVNGLTLAEGWVGAGKNYENFLCITVGEGIGAGLMIDGSLYRGAIGGAGEIGHTTLDPDGPRCRCGEKGCLETLASDYFLRSKIDEIGLDPPTLDHLAELAEKGEKRALGVFHNMGRNLGLGVKNLVNTLNPEAVLLGGERVNQSEHFMPNMKEEILNHSFPEEAKELKIVKAGLGKEGWLIGAALLSIRNFFSLPLHNRVQEGNASEQMELTGK